MPQGTEEILRKSYLFAKLSNEELSEVAKVLREETYEPGAYVVKEGDPGESLYLVATGGVNVTKEPDNHFLSYLGAGGYFGEMALFLPNSRRTASCVAMLKTTCLILEKSALEGFCLSRPAIGVKIYQEIIRALAERLAATSADLAMLMKSQVSKQDQVSEMAAAFRNRK